IERHPAERELLLAVQLVDQRLLRLEVAIDRPRADLGAIGDLGHRGAVEPALDEQLERRRHDRLALVPAALPGHRLLARPALRLLRTGPRGHRVEATRFAVRRRRHAMRNEYSFRGADATKIFFILQDAEIPGYFRLVRCARQYIGRRLA